NKKYILKTAAEAEQFSNHPIAKSILDAYGEEENLLNNAEFEEISGAGIKAEFNNKVVMAGNEKLMNQFSIDFKKVLEEGTVIYLAENDQFIGHILINDVLKEDAEKTVKALKNMKIKVSMLTGDRKLAAAQIAEKLSLDSYYSELLPGEKVEKIEELLDNKGKLIFVGDGINDAPVLARSDIGVAMGALGSDAAIEAADIVLMTDEPSKIITAVNIARKTKKIVWQNIYMALGVKGIVMILGAFGSATMWEAVFADVGVALLAVFNVMRILKSD
ncbi:MAG: HAD-IC family P-type ATPase, partial [Bacillota bacterium]